MKYKKNKIPNMFNKIGKVCEKCNTCCRTYGWLLKKEAESLSKKGYPVIKINNKINCIDSFKRDSNNNIILDKIPICRFYKLNRCTIQEDKPLDCKLYPIKLIFRKDKPVFVLSLGCKYISKMTEFEIKKLIKELKDKINKIPKKELKEYIKLMYEINSISKPKRFWRKEIF